MMKRNVTIAVARLQGRIRRATDIRKDELLREALDLLLSQPYRDGDPNKLIQRAIDAARRRQRRRARALAKSAGRIDWLDTTRSSGSDGSDLSRFLGKQRNRDREVIGLAAIGARTRDIAAALGVTETCARSRLWRARKKLRAARAA